MIFETSTITYNAQMQANGECYSIWLDNVLEDLYLVSKNLLYYFEKEATEGRGNKLRSICIITDLPSN